VSCFSHAVRKEMMINPKKYGRTIYDREQSGFTLSILLPMRSASSYLQSTLGVRRWVFRVFLTTISSSRRPPPITYHLSRITLSLPALALSRR